MGGSSPALLWLSKKHLRLTWLDSLKTPTCVLSMPKESPSCPRTSNLPVVSVANALKESSTYYLLTNGLFQGHYKFSKRFDLMSILISICLIQKNFWFEITTMTV